MKPGETFTESFSALREWTESRNGADRDLDTKYKGLLTNMQLYADAIKNKEVDARFSQLYLFISQQHAIIMQQREQHHTRLQQLLSKYLFE